MQLCVRLCPSHFVIDLICLRAMSLPEAQPINLDDPRKFIFCGTMMNHEERAMEIFVGFKFSYESEGMKGI